MPIPGHGLAYGVIDGSCRLPAHPLEVGYGRAKGVGTGRRFGDCTKVDRQSRIDSVTQSGDHVTERLGMAGSDVEDARCLRLANGNEGRRRIVDVEVIPKVVGLAYGRLAL